MKLLTKFQDKDEAFSVKYQLEEKGIPIHIGSENSGPALGVLYGGDCYTLWVEIDAQYESALKAISNDEYSPENPVNMQDYREFNENMVQSFREKFSKVNDYVLNVIMIGVVGYVAFRLYTAVNM